MSSIARVNSRAYSKEPKVAGRRLLHRISQAVEQLICCRTPGYGSEMELGPWIQLEEPSLLRSLAEAIRDFGSLASSLEKQNVIAGDNVDFAQTQGPFEKLQGILGQVQVKDQQSFDQFRRCLIDSGQYDAVEVFDDAFTLSSIPRVEPRPVYLPPSPPTPRVDAVFQDAIHEGFVRLGIHGAEADYPNEVDSPPPAPAPSGEVTVRRATVLRMGPNIYPLSQKTRGLCLIFNNEKFPKFPDKDRPGSESDVRRMELLFRDMDFTVRIHNDMSSRALLGCLQSYAEHEDLANHEAFVCIIMSHGGLDHVYGNDYEQLKLQTVFELFNNNSCAGLKERPKIFFIQACRGSGIDNGTGARDTLDDLLEPPSDVQTDAGLLPGRVAAVPPEELPRRISCWSDMYIAYAVVEGYESNRDANTGSWFMKAVFDIMANHAFDEDLDTLMERVSTRVLEKARHDGQRQCPEIKKIGWRKKLFFNPGLRINND